MTIEAGAVWRGLQEVQEGADPADVYARLTGEAIDPEEAIENELLDHVEEAHDFPECREKALTVGLCYGFTCQVVPAPQVGHVRVMTDCPCKCHQGELTE